MKTCQFRRRNLWGSGKIWLNVRSYDLKKTYGSQREWNCGRLEKDDIISATELQMTANINVVVTINIKFLSMCPISFVVSVCVFHFGFRFF